MLSPVIRYGDSPDTVLSHCNRIFYLRIMASEPQRAAKEQSLPLGGSQTGRRLISVASRSHHLPLRKHLKAPRLFFAPSKETELLANPSKFFFIISSNPCPPLIRATSMKIPQNHAGMRSVMASCFISCDAMRDFTGVHVYFHNLNSFLQA